MDAFVHCDLKPDNILVERVDPHHLLSESIALYNFELSTGRDDTTLTQTSVGNGDAGLLGTGAVVVSARNLVPASDIYAVAMLALFPFTRRELQDVMIGSDLLHLPMDTAAADQLGNKRVGGAGARPPPGRPPTTRRPPREALRSQCASLTSLRRSAQLRQYRFSRRSQSTPTSVRPTSPHG